MPEVQSADVVVIPSRECPDPGQLISTTLAGRTIVVANVDGDYCALDGNCTHEECPLVNGWIDGHNVVCECHGGTFDVRDGEPVDGPVFVPLNVYRVTSDGDDITVHVAPT